MDGLWIHLICEIVGPAIVLLVIADVFFTVLYPRVSSGIISRRVGRCTWILGRAIARRLPRGRDVMLSYMAPLMLIGVVVTWYFLLAIGSAIVIWPNIGKGIQATTGSIDRDLSTALYIAGDAMTTVGVSDYAPKTPLLRITYTTISFLGISVITLVVTYLLEVYTALQSRNVFAIKLHLMSGQTADAAVLLGGIGPEGRFETGYAHLCEIAAEMTHFKESHHFFSVLFYFRFQDPSYSFPRVALLVLDCVSLLRTALDDKEYGWLKKSAAVEQLWRGGMETITLLSSAFLPEKFPASHDPDENKLAHWRDRYTAALAHLRNAGLKTIADEEAGFQAYVSLRARWNRYIERFGTYLIYEMENIERFTHLGDAHAPDVVERLRAAS